jgi:hypothetical protein
LRRHKRFLHYNIENPTRYDPYSCEYGPERTQQKDCFFIEKSL